MNDILALLQSSWADALAFLESLLQPWRFYQIIILIVLAVASTFIARFVKPPIETWMRGLEGMRASQLRFMLVIFRRTRGIIFALLAWMTYLVMQEMTWPSRSYLIGIAATLATAWIFVAISTRLIRNAAIRSIVRWGAWAFVTVRVLGIQEDAEAALDSLALSMGETRLSLLLLVKAVVVLGLLIGIANFLARFLDRRLAENQEMSPSLRVLTTKLTHVMLFAFAVFIALQTIGFDLTSLTVLSGAVGLGLGFGLQKVVSNLVSGVIVLMDKSIKPGDVISLGDTFGWVSELNARFVAVITRDGKEYLIPNEDLITTQVVNWTHSSNLVRLDVYFGVSYDSDPHHVRKIAREAAATEKRVVGNPAPVCHIVGFGDSSIDFILRFWIEDPSAGLTNVRGNVYLALWDALKRENIDIPFPRRDIQMLPPAEAAPKLFEGD
ncbi:mechanosensitive ion channel family protein [Algicella marina]|uniref:Mechanosensitive ion channel n=1 Tax=Algicella marina TaxID=2683284 RepID=A0A6P1T1T6_9RHOB|nr:mechanosensitive ion channel domain-containing protein [Algicella marina]QHQ36698.1 mechanosensitive ion channel [Algicella marina]